MNDRRIHPRFRLDRPVVVLPVLPDGSPDVEHASKGATLDVARGGLQLDIEARAALREGASLAVGVEQAGGGVAYEGVVVRHIRQRNGHVAFGGVFAGDAHRLLETGSRLPAFSPDKLAYDLPGSNQVYDKWAQAGVLKPVLMDHVQVCPRCGGLPTFRMGCRRCGSGRLVEDQLIHHFACANVDLASKYEVDGMLKCPKCRTKKLVVGSDYEYLTTHRCLACRWSDYEPTRVGHCLRCSLRFAGHEAVERELVGYDAQRLDVLALLPPS
ncbi:MAG: hypothetical protein GC164_11345 [Phycisphaera sp.]|nr:hypothetical protein [Phycisphaera sp.]